AAGKYYVLGSVDSLDQADFNRANNILSAPRQVEVFSAAWTGGSGFWDQGSNWNTGTVPLGGEDVLDDTGATAATITSQWGDRISVHSIALGSNDTLSIAGGSLTIGANSTLSGDLSLSGSGSLTATGSGTTITVNGTTSVSAGSFFAKNGATLNVPQL